MDNFVKFLSIWQIIWEKKPENNKCPLYDNKTFCPTIVKSSNSAENQQITYIRASEITSNNDPVFVE